MWTAPSAPNRTPNTSGASRLLLWTLAWLIVYAAAVAVIPGCAKRGSTTIERVTVQPDGATIEEKITVKQPSNSVSPATASVIRGDVSTSTGAAQKSDQALASLSKSANWLAVLLIVAGLGSLIARVWFPIAPVSASVMLIAAGVGCWVFPVLIDRYLLWLLIAVGIIVALWFFGVWDNSKLLRKEPPDEPAQPPTT